MVIPAARLELPHELSMQLSTCVLCSSGGSSRVARDAVQLSLRLTHFACIRCAQLLVSTLTSENK